MKLNADKLYKADEKQKQKILNSLNSFIAKRDQKKSDWLLEQICSCVSIRDQTLKAEIINLAKFKYSQIVERQK